MSDREEGELNSDEEQQHLYQQQPPPVASIKTSENMAEHFRLNFGHPIHRESYFGQLASRQSIDMVTSPIESPLTTESCVMFVDEPLEESDDTSPPAGPPVLVPLIPYVMEPGMYIVPRQTPVKEPLAVTARPDLNAVDEPASNAQRPPLIAVEKQPLTETVAEKPLPVEIPIKRMQKKFTKNLLQHIQAVLLENLNPVSSASSSSSEFEEDAKELDELRRKLIHHNKEMHDELDKRERLTKEMETCQLMINHHYERMNTIMRSMGDVSRQSLRQARKSVSRTKSDGKKKRKKICSNFKNRVTTILNELSVMDEEVIAPAPVRIDVREKQHDAASELAEMLNNLVEDPGTEFNQSMDAPSFASVAKSPKRVERQLFVDKAFEEECLRRMFQARFGIQPLPHIVVPSRRSRRCARKKTFNPNPRAIDESLEREEALRRKLLEQMKKKERLFPSLHEKKKVFGNENDAAKKQQKNLNANDGKVMEEIFNLSPIVQTWKPVNDSTVPVTTEKVFAAPKLFKSLSDISTVLPSAVTERPKIVPTMKDIIELKKEFTIALNKKRNGISSNNASSTSNHSPIKESFDENASSKSSSPVKALTPLPKPVDKENAGINPLKRAALSENNDQFKKPRLIPEKKSKRLNDFEIREQEILFNSPRIAVRNFILSPQYDIKNSIERLRHKNDPNIELCYFEIFGICNDAECQYQHQRDFTLNDQEILEEILGYIPERATSSTESIHEQAQKLLETNSLDEIIKNLRNETSHLDFIKLAVDGCV